MNVVSSDRHSAAAVGAEGDGAGEKALKNP